MFYCDGALELVVISFVDGAHTACADRFEDPVMCNGLNRERLHIVILAADRRR
jgi:hypothetical protein